MTARTDEGKIIRELLKRDGNVASFATLAQALGGKWTPEAVRTKVEQLEHTDSPVFLVKGGAQHLGVEKCKEPGLYRAAARGIERTWVKNRSIPRARVLQTWRLTSDHGNWTRPDFVVVSTSLVKGVAVNTYHSIEVEQPKGFDVQSVYQAHEQGRGASFAWVFFSGALPDPERWSRLKSIAGELSVGLVHMPKATAPGGWKTLLPAKRRSPKPAEAVAFERRCETVNAVASIS